MKPVLRLLPLALIAGLVGCQTPRGVSTAALSPPPPAPAPEIRYRPIPTDTLTELLVGEFAAQRGEVDLALVQYARQAVATRDPDVIARANQIALHTGLQPLATELAELWLSVEPDRVDAHYALIWNLLRTGQYERALREADRLMAKHGDIYLEKLLAANWPSTDNQRSDLANGLAKLLQEHPDNPRLTLIHALLAAETQPPADALRATEQALRLQAKQPVLLSLKARLLTELNRSDEAETLLRQAVAAMPDNGHLRANYARVLLRLQNYSAAEPQFRWLTEQTDAEPEIILTYGLVALQNKHLDIAEQALNRLDGEEHNLQDEVSYYLGQIAEDRRDIDKALHHFQEVGPGQHFLAAQDAAADLLREHGRLEEARRWLQAARQRNAEADLQLTAMEAEQLGKAGQHEAAYKLLSDSLRQHPDAEPLLYGRAIAAEKLGRLDELEADLRRILAREPDNVTALNALGYTLIDKTARLDEARGYIERAFALRPNDPAVIDSMGWLQYRLGKPADALVHLRRAYALMPDAEIAAHLGEVLWISGQREEARRVWDDAQRRQPESNHLASTRARLEK